MTTILYGPEMPEEYQRAALERLEEYEWLIPTWCHTLRVEYLRGDEDGSVEPTRADCLAEPQYRQARIRIYSSFLELEPAQRANTILHELLHIATAPLSRALADIIEAAKLSADGRKLADRMLHDAEESVVEDLAAAIGGRGVLQAQEYEGASRLEEFNEKLFAFTESMKGPKAVGDR